MEIEPIVGSICQKEWTSFSGMYTTEETHHMAQLHGNFTFPVNDLEDCCSYGLQPTFWPNHDSTMNITTIDETKFWPTEIIYPNTHCPSQMNSHDSDNADTPIFHNPIWATTDGLVSMDVSMSNTRNSSSLYLIDSNDSQNQKMCEEDESIGSLNVVVLADNCTPIRWKDFVYPSSAEDEKNDSRDTRKRSRLPEDKMKRNVKSKRIQRLDFSSKSDEDGIAQPSGQSSSTSYSEDLSSSPKLKGEAGSSSKEPAIFNLNGKTRASRGSATDPQSLYARKRRERINERLRILQNLVPNGTKVDISTMLEEAVHYVKFLQLQIKLLSSNELWMYAPIAYNGMNIGLDVKVTKSE